MSSPFNFGIAIHGGAGTILRSHMSIDQEREYSDALRQAVRAGYSILSEGGTSLDAVQKAVEWLEDCPLFNAGKGSVYTAEGTHEMDAAIMEGSSRRAGAVAGVIGVKNPVALARRVMDNSGHVLLAGRGAEAFAKLQGLEFCEKEYFDNDFRYSQWQEIRGTTETALDHVIRKDEKFGTVGAVALDKQGHLAAATSTGGMTNKRFGRVGDSPVIGSGTYANNATCAVSCTGSGEFFLRGVVAYDVSCLMEYKNLTLQEACDRVVHDRLLSLGGDGGLIAADANGNLCFSFNTEGMYRARKSADGLEEVLIYKNSTE